MTDLEFSKSAPMMGKPKRTLNGIETIVGLHRFDVDELRDLAGDKVFARGVAYHEDGNVEIVTFDRARVLARVMGSEVYRCELVGSGKKFSGECSCRAFEEWGFCKHLVASALAANSLGPEALEHASNRFAKIRKHLRTKGVDKLVEMVVGLAERDPSLLQELELSAAAATADDKTLFAQFRKAITEATRTGGYVEYGEMRDWVQGIESVLGRIAGLIENGRAILVLRLLDHFFARMDEALGSVDDSGGGGGGAYAKACEIHLAACSQAKPDPVALARALFAREVDSEWEFFHGASETYEDVLGDAGLAEYRRLASEAWQKIRSPRATGQDDQFSRRYALGSILESFAEREGDVDGVIAIRSKDLSTAYAYLGIAQLCLDHGREAEALKWAEDGLWQFEDNPDERLIFFASELYRRIGRKEEADKLLWRMFERRPSIDLYERLKSAAGTDRMQADAVRDRALGSLRSQLGKPQGRAAAQWSAPVEFLVQLTMAEGLLSDAWIIVNGHGCSEGLLEQLANASERSHPAEALKVYADRVERRVLLGGQINYEYACGLIGRMQLVRRDIGETAQHVAYLDDLKSRHKAKRNFMKLLTAGRA
jgi:tetratricopeptide (TPR) repeat protein